MADLAEDAPWLSLTEASQRTGRHVNALRSMVRRGRIESRKGNHGQWLVRLPAELPADPGSADGPADDETVAALNAEVAELREELAGLRAGLKAAGDVAEARLAAKDELVAELRTMLGELRAELVETRRPWWRRWIG
jgi:ribosomal protein L29